MLGSEFVQAYSRKGPTVWEQAALDAARQGSLTPWPFVDVHLADTNGNTATIHVQSDVLSIGTLEDHVRIALTTAYAQSIANLFGALVPTPWLEYAIWKSAPVKLPPIAMVPNQGANLEQYAAHSRIIDQQLATAQAAPGQLVSGIKKGVVVANFYKPGKVLLFGWYRPAPDVFDDGKAMETTDRQPIQPKSNVHADGYVDYSQVIRLIAPMCIVNGQTMETVALYQHPTLCKLVNPDAVNPPEQRGPIRTPRYPAPVAPVSVFIGSSLSAARSGLPASSAAATFIRPPFGRVPFSPDPTEIALDMLADRQRGIS